MSLASSRHSTPSISTTSTPSSSMPSQPISFPTMRSSLDSLLTTTTTLTHRTSSTYSSSAYANWPSSRRGFTPTSTGVPSAYVSDEDLFGGSDDDEPYLSEPPAPPRPAEMWAPVMLARPLLPPVTKTRRRSSSGEKKERKARKASVSSSKG